MATIDRGHVLRPEWVFDVASGLQTYAGLSWARLRLHVDSILVDLPPESEAETLVLRAWLDKASLEKVSHASANSAVEDQKGHMDAASSAAKAKPRTADAVAKSEIARAAHHLDRDYSAHWTVESLARRVGCNRTDLEKGFLSFRRHTVHSYLTVRRIEASKSLLRTTAWRIEEVGKAVG